MTLAHLWLSWAANLARDFERLHGAYRRVNTSPAGAAIMVGSNFPVNRARTAELLGFDAVHENCADAILELNADDSLDMPAVIAILYHSMAKWADDIIQWTTSEYAFVDIPDRYCGTSSIMMQKKNVIGPAEVKGASAEALGCFVTSYHALKGTTGLPITERYYALDMLWRVADNAVRDLGWFCDLLPALEIRKEHMREQAWRHWATATDLAGALVRERDLPWRTAHQIVGILVRLCEERGLGPADVTPALLDEAAIAYHDVPAGLDQRSIAAALDPRAIHRRAHAARRTGAGGIAAPGAPVRRRDSQPMSERSATSTIGSQRQRAVSRRQSTRSSQARLDSRDDRRGAVRRGCLRGWQLQRSVPGSRSSPTMRPWSRRKRASSKLGALDARRPRILGSARVQFHRQPGARGRRRARVSVR